MGAKQMEKESLSPVVAGKEKMLFDSSKRFKKICVFCGSSSGKKGVFSDEALNLGRELVSARIAHVDISVITSKCLKVMHHPQLVYRFAVLQSSQRMCRVVGVVLTGAHVAGEPEDRFGVRRRKYWTHGSSSSDRQGWRWSRRRVSTPFSSVHCVV